MGRSMPVAFQNPEPVTLLGLMLFRYFLPRRQKKYHSFSPPAVLASEVYNLIRFSFFSFSGVNFNSISHISVNKITFEL